MQIKQIIKIFQPKALGKFTKKRLIGGPKSLRAQISRKLRKALSWRWFSLAFLLFLYLAGGIATSFAVYKQHSHDPYIEKLLIIYPLPASIASGNIVYVKELYQRIRFAKQFEFETGQKVGSFDDLLGAYLKRMTEDKLIMGATEGLGIHLREEEVNKVLDNLYKKNGGKEEVKNTLNLLYKMKLADFRQLVRYQIVRDIIQSEKVSKVKIRHILVESESVAKEVLEQIAQNKISFEEAAKQYSKDEPTRDKGGEIGEVYYGNLPVEIERVAFNPEQTKVGKTYPKPIQTGFGYHIIRIDSRNIGEINLSFDGWVNKLKTQNRVHYFFGGIE